MTPDNDDQFDDDLEDFDDGDSGDDVGGDLDMDPMDDSSDDSTGGSESDDDLSTDDDDWDDDSGDEGDESLAPKQKKSGGDKGKLIKIVIGVIVLGGIGFAAMQMLGGGSKPPAPVATNTAQVPDRVPAGQELPPVTQPAPVASPQDGILNNAANLDEMARVAAGKLQPTPPSAENPDTLPMPTAMSADDTPANPLAADAPIRMPNANDIMKQPSPPPADPAMAVDPKQLPPVIQAQTDVPPVNSAPVTPVIAAPVSDDMTAKLDQVMARLDRLEGEIKELKGSEGAAVSDEIDALRASLSALERKVGSPASKPKVLSAASDDSDRSVATKSSGKKQSSSSSKSSSSAHKEPTKSLSTNATRTSTQWVLKGAQPGHAMVAKKGENDVLAISVGDNLKGIGKVTSISLKDGRWVVQGTEGRIAR